jgi:hypothetical protein
MKAGLLKGTDTPSQGLGPGTGCLLGGPYLPTELQVGSSAHSTEAVSSEAQQQLEAC